MVHVSAYALQSYLTNMDAQRNHCILYQANAEHCEASPQELHHSTDLCVICHMHNHNLMHNHNMYNHANELCTKFREFTQLYMYLNVS